MILVALVAAVAAVHSGRAAPAAAGRPRLVPARLSPLSLAGSGFARRERVRVVVTPSTGEPVVRRLRARGDGSFRLAVPGVRSCSGFDAVATGRRGGRASMSFAAGLGCLDG